MLFCGPGASQGSALRSASRQLVEPHRASGQDLALARLGERRRLLGDQRWRAREEPVSMRIVGGPQDLVRTDVVGEHAEPALDRLERNPAIPLEQLARSRLEAGVVEALVIEVAVHPIQPWRDPAAAGFQEADTDPREALAHSAP